MSWYQLGSAIKEVAHYVQVYKDMEVVACPFCGEPLRLGPPSSAAVRYCPWGHYQYPRDYDQDRDQGM